MVKLIFILSITVLVFTPNSLAQDDDTGVLLYSQTTVDYYGSIISSYDLFEQTIRYQTADDFISSGDWSIYQVTVPNGNYFYPDLAEGFNIYIYKNNQFKPDSLIYFAANQSYSQENGFAYIELDSPAILMGGHYWLSVQAVIDMQSNDGEVWTWVLIEGPVENGALYKNPGSPSGPFDWSPVYNTPFSSGGTDMYFELYGIPSGPTDNEEQLTSPLTFSLQQNYPNPFNPSTKIKYSIPQSSNVVLNIYDVLGKELVTMVNAEQPAGNYEVDFDAPNLPSGTYFYQIKAGSLIKTKKMILMR